MTYSSSGNDSYYNSAQAEDNRYIYLNGLKIEILSQSTNAQGKGKDMKVRVSWHNYDVNGNVRWTGNIILNRQVTVKAGDTLLLDQGLTPTKAAGPQTIDGEYVFADKTVFTCKANSRIIIENGAKLILRNGSKLVMENGSNIIIRGSGRLIVECGSTLESKQYSYIQLQDAFATVREEPGSTVSYWTNGTNTTVSGSGKRSTFSSSTVISNKTYTANERESGATITTSGTVTVQSGTVIYNAKTISLQSGLQVNPGAVLELDTDTFDCQ